MFTRTRERVKRLAKSALAKETVTSTFEMLNVLWPYYMGAVLLEMFLQRRWVLFFIDLAASCLLAFSSFMLLRRRRVIIEQMRLYMKEAAEVLDVIVQRQIGELESDLRPANFDGLRRADKIWWPKTDPKDVN